MTEHFNRRSERAKRKALRHNATGAEQRLWQHLRAQQIGAKFRRQYSVDAYVIDFYAPRVKLAIEVDGDSHFTPEAIEYDKVRTTCLNRFGIEVLRFTNLEILENIEGVLARIDEAIKTTSPGPSLVRRGDLRLGGAQPSASFVGRDLEGAGSQASPSLPRRGSGGG